jgi:hypothetical protein
MTTQNFVRAALIFGLVVGGATACGGAGGEGTQGAGAGAERTGQPVAGQRAEAPDAVDVTASDMSVDVGQVRIMLSIAQRPIVAGETERFCVRAEIDGIPFDLADGSLSLAPAGSTREERHALVESEGCYAADVVLPPAEGAATRYYATVQGVVEEQPVTARFQFDVSNTAS